MARLVETVELLRRDAELPAYNCLCVADLPHASARRLDVAEDLLAFLIALGDAVFGVLPIGVEVHTETQTPCPALE